jgi:hypothetical protein
MSTHCTKDTRHVGYQPLAAARSGCWARHAALEHLILTPRRQRGPQFVQRDDCEGAHALVSALPYHAHAHAYTHVHAHALDKAHAKCLCVYMCVCAKITSIAVCVGYLELEHRMRARCVFLIDFLRNPPNKICHILRVRACRLSSDTLSSHYYSIF